MRPRWVLAAALLVPGVWIPAFLAGAGDASPTPPRRGRLAPGDRVVAGVTPLGRARSFPFRSQVDRYVRGGRPHVHVEVVDARARDEAEGRRGPGG